MCHLGLKLIKEVTYVISHLYKSIFKYDDFISYLLNFLSFLASSLLEVIVYNWLFQSSAIILDDKVRYTTFGYWRRLKIINIKRDKQSKPQKGFWCWKLRKRSHVNDKTIHKSINNYFKHRHFKKYEINWSKTSNYRKLFSIW